MSHGANGMKLPNITPREYDRAVATLAPLREDHKPWCAYLRDMEMEAIYGLFPVFEHDCSCGYWERVS